jgi:hypothetical protein
MTHKLERKEGCMEKLNEYATVEVSEAARNDKDSTMDRADGPTARRVVLHRAREYRRD